MSRSVMCPDVHWLYNVQQKGGGRERGGEREGDGERKRGRERGKKGGRMYMYIRTECMGQPKVILLESSDYLYK